MEFRPGDILYRKYSDQNDLYCVVAIFNASFTISSLMSEIPRMCLFPYYQGRGENYLTEMQTSVESWYIPVDLNDYAIKDKFIEKIKLYLNDNLGKPIAYKKILDNLTYIEILAELKKYDKSDIVEKEEKK